MQTKIPYSCRLQSGKIHDHNRVVPEEEAGASENKLNDTAESESIENIMEEVERISREVKEGKEDDKKVSL